MKYSKFYKNPYKKVRTTISIEKFNNLIDHGKTKKIVQISERNYFNQIKELVSDLITLPNKKIINVAGPSSAGKTTTASNIKKVLESKNRNAMIISLDNFLIPLMKRERLPNGELDFESINTIDKELFQKFLDDLINKGEATMPEYDFVKGDRKPKGHKVKFGEGDYIIMEGLHALNPTLIGPFSEHVYKVYICPYKDYYYHAELILTAKEMRLMRRSIRDFYKRGSSVDDTIKMWQTITDSEYAYIKPYKFMCDYFINSTIDYEVCIYAQYLKPILEEVKDYKATWPMFEALDKFAKLELDVVPEDSLLWEFLPKK